MTLLGFDKTEIRVRESEHFGSTLPQTISKMEELFPIRTRPETKTRSALQCGGSLVLVLTYGICMYLYYNIRNSNWAIKLPRQLKYKTTTIYPSRTSIQMEKMRMCRSEIMGHVNGRFSLMDMRIPKNMRRYMNISIICKLSGWPLVGKLVSRRDAVIC